MSDAPDLPEDRLSRAAHASSSGAGAASGERAASGEGTASAGSASAEAASAEAAASAEGASAEAAASAGGTSGEAAAPEAASAEAAAPPAGASTGRADIGEDPGLDELIRARALELGFASAGIARPAPSDHGDFLERWLAEGLHGEMAYLARPDAVARRKQLRRTMPEARSVVVVTHPYAVEDAEGVPDDPSIGVVARYARGRDYHKVVKKKLKALLRWIDQELLPDRDVTGRPYVDTGPILERELGRRAGLGWFGKNTMLIDPRRGSYFFLGCLLLDLELEPDEPFEADRCGTCRRCLDACPTGALLGRDEDGAPVMDARLCISYLTIEHRGPIPEELRSAIGNRVFGCDICQEVCPFNQRFAEGTDEPGYAARGPGERPVGVEALPGERAVEAGEDVSAETSGVGSAVHPGTSLPPLVELMRLAREEWDAFTRGSAIRRAGYAGFKRNVAVALGNWLASLEGEVPEEAVVVLREALEDESELVREHVAWALGQGEAGLE